MERNDGNAKCTVHNAELAGRKRETSFFHAEVRDSETNGIKWLVINSLGVSVGERDKGETKSECTTHSAQCRMQASR
jgi:hypothetical protein